ncbi:hypothetical protein HMPREF1487_09576 [Pseudomonas sp. HPB0071]|nr:MULTISPECIES: hypothetical protein [Pseudomonas]ENA26535.1 hypothetical protein HMPREF1487_09576 [Pseudomonas sp. HPB0071]
MKRKKYSSELKREAVELVRCSGANWQQTSQEIGVAPTCSVAGFERLIRA